MNVMKMVGRAMGRADADSAAWMDMEIDPEDAMAMMEALHENPSEKLVDSDFFNRFEDDFDDDDLD
jgi:hypothetical protein